MKLRHVYLLLAILGAIVPLAWFAPWLLQHGPDIPLLLRELFSTRAGGFFGLDVLISAIVLFRFIRGEASRLHMRHAWLPVVSTLLAGVSCGLPLFLYLRQRTLDEHIAP